MLTDSVLAAPVDAELSPNAVELLDPRIFGRVAGHERGRSDCRFGLAGAESSSAATRPVLATDQKPRELGLRVLLRVATLDEF